jgi:hypothetical protein
MDFVMRPVLRLAATVILMKMAFASAALAQDVMQLDLMFRESLLHRAVPDGQADEPAIRRDAGRRLHSGGTLRSVKAARRRPDRLQHKDMSPASANGGF